jgi:hypothetical protein
VHHQPVSHSTLFSLGAQLLQVVTAYIALPSMYEPFSATKKRDKDKAAKEREKATDEAEKTIKMTGEASGQKEQITKPQESAR